MKTVLIAGGSTGIGRACVDRFVEQGDKVFILDRNAAEAERALAEHGADMIGFKNVDLTSADAVAEGMDAVRKGAPSLDALFVSIGFLASAPLADFAGESWERTLAVNLTAPFLLAKSAAPLLSGSACASMVFTASTGALRGTPGIPAYNATKAGLVNLVRSLAAELGPAGITVNAVSPGWIETSFNEPYWSQFDDRAAAVSALERSIPLGRQGTPQEIAEVVEFLCSERARYITGQNIVVDGGFSAV